MVNTAEELTGLIKSAFAELGGPLLTYAMFRKYSDVPMSQVFRHFDSWTEACKSAGIRSGEASPSNITPNYSKGQMHALQEVKKVANSLGVSTISKSQFDSYNPEVRACTVVRLWGGWLNALEAAGLDSHPNYHEEISLDVLAQEFLRILSELGHIPTVNQLARRSDYCKNTFTRKFGSYTDFKIAAIQRLQEQASISAQMGHLLGEHLAIIAPSNPAQDLHVVPPHHTGSHLGFRGHACVPTYEMEVVSIFGSVADDLGFEIVAQRAAFPDCEARRLTDRRRKRYAKCLIEFEFRSSDYKKHKHPMNGCDLIVCWKHDWVNCPIEVLELSAKIKTLSGWK